LTISTLEFPVCALCGSDNRRAVYADARDISIGVPGQFTIVRCQACGLTYLCPRPTAQKLSNYYPEHYGPFSNAGRSKILSTIRGIAQLPYQLRFGQATATVAPFGRRRMLDVGCGAGEYLQTMQQRGWDVHGVDLSSVAVQEATRRVGHSKVTVGTLETLEPDLNEFDLITMNHCLEHVPDPRSTLQETHRRLAVGGKVKIIVPDVSGFEAKLFGRYWAGLDVPRHLVDFSQRTLSGFLRQTGFTIESSRPEFAPWLFYFSFQWVLQQKMRGRWERFKLALTVPVFLIAALSYSFGNRGAIEVIARKTE